MRALLQAWSSGLEQEFEARLLWTAACLAFFGFLRSGELTLSTLKTPTPISAADVELIPPHAPSSIRVFLKRAKSDTFGKGVNIFLRQTAGDICPVTELANYLTRRPQKAQGSLFIYEDGSPLLKGQFVKKVKRALAHQKIDCSKYSGHSFRIGVATAAAAAGILDHMIKMMGRWKSSAYLLYLRTPREALTVLSGRLIQPSRGSIIDIGKSEHRGCGVITHGQTHLISSHY